MKRSSTAAIVLITVVVILALAAVGFGVYRLGYAQGLTASAGKVMHQRFLHDFGARFPHGMRRGMMPYFGMTRPPLAYPLWSFVPGLLLIVGVVALVIIAINSLVHSNRKGNAVEVDSSASGVE